MAKKFNISTYAAAELTLNAFQMILKMRAKPNLDDPAIMPLLKKLPTVARFANDEECKNDVNIPIKLWNRLSEKFLENDVRKQSEEKNARRNRQKLVGETTLYITLKAIGKKGFKGVAYAKAVGVAEATVSLTLQNAKIDLLDIIENDQELQTHASIQNIRLELNKTKRQ